MMWEDEMSNKSRNKVIIIGMDGVSWNYLKHLRNRGFLASVENISKKGIIGSIETIPPYTAPMWTSITSGVNPGKHGVYLFYKTDESGKYLGLVKALDVGHPRLYDMVSYNGGTSLVANLPFTSPPLPSFRGYLISDWLSPNPTAKPDWLFRIFRGRLADVEDRYAGDGFCKYGAHNIALMETLLEEKVLRILEETQLVFVMIDFLDKIVHYDARELEKFSSPCLKENLELLDELVKAFSSSLRDEHTTMVIVSDHGNAPVRYKVTLASIFKEHGLIRPKYETLRDTFFPTREQDNRLTDKILSKFTSLVMRDKRLGRLFTIVGRKLLNARPVMRDKVLAVARPVPDEEKSTVILRDYSIYVNEKILGSENINAHVKKVIALLEEAQVTTGHRFLYKVLPGKNGLFRGPYATNAPHIVLANNEGYELSGFNLNAPPIEKVNNLYNHIPHNMHIILPHEKDETINTMALHIQEPWDYAVLVLKALDYPIPHDTDSKICERAKIKCKLRNYNTPYNIARNLASKNVRKPF